jgi:hypothetical protein
MDRPYDIYMVYSVTEQACELARGKAIIFAWEWSEEDGDLERWQDALLIACDVAGLPVYFLPVRDKSLTFAINAADRPSVETFLDSVGQIEQSRFTLEPIPSKEDIRRAHQRSHRLTSHLRCSRPVSLGRMDRGRT